MRSLLKMIPVLITLLLCCACSESGDSKPAEETLPKLPPPEFTAAETPQALVDKYLADLSGERYVSREMATELEGRTVLVDAAKMVRRHHTVAFIDWYFSERYLSQVKDLVARKVDRMDYQLKILEATAEDAYQVILTTDVGILEHKKALMAGPLQQEWQVLEDKSQLVVLTSNSARLPLRVVNENGAWKLEVVRL